LQRFFSEAPPFFNYLISLPFWRGTNYSKLATRWQEAFRRARGFSQPPPIEPVEQHTDQEATTMSFVLTSADFDAGGNIPAVHTCDGANTSPALSWSGTPPTAKSLVLIIDDPDAPDPAAPKMTWVHWVLYNIPANATGLPAAARASDLPSGTQAGLNDWKNGSYGGPCPPIGRHRYFHKLYALDVALPDLGHPSKAQLEKAMHHHIVAQAELIGTYQRK
jgi:Raf kinase inhibitor-like YbhB/YbcL family protein